MERESITSFSERFSIFSDQYGLIDEMKKFETWLDFRKVQNSIIDFAPGLSVPFDRGFFTKSRSANDQLLALIISYDEKISLMLEVDEILRRLDKKMFKVLYLHYFDGISWEVLCIQEKNPYLYEDVLVSFAEADEDYLFQSSIRDDYEQMKRKYEDILQIALSKISENFEIELGVCRQKFDCSVFEKNDKKCGCYKRKKKIFLYIILYQKNELTKDDLYRFLPQLVGGRKILKSL